MLRSPRERETARGPNGARRIAFLLALLGPVACSKPAPPPSDPPPAATASPAPPPDLPGSVLRWAGEERVAIVDEHGSVSARAVDSGRSRRLYTGPVQRAALDTALELLWIQGATSLDVLDLRDARAEPVPIARGLPENVSLEVSREHDAAAEVSMPQPSGCDQSRILVVHWTADPRLSLLASETGGQWREPEGAALVGAGWLRAEVGRAPGPSSVARRSFPLRAPPGPIPVDRKRCDDGMICGAAIPFDGSGRLLVVTSFTEGDCQHYGCRLFDPATRKTATPPEAMSWTSAGAAPEGPCGPYQFDRSGQRFLFEDRICTVGGACRALGGQAVGWLGGGTDVGK